MNSEISKEPVGISTAICTHVPADLFRHVGQTTKCKLCGIVLMYNNNPAGSKTRMSKKMRRKIKAQQTHPLYEQAIGRAKREAKNDK